MQLPSLSVVAAVLSVLASVSAAPIPCPDSKLDLILLGQLPKNACCSYGTCRDHVNVSALENAGDVRSLNT